MKNFLKAYFLTVVIMDILVAGIVGISLRFVDLSTIDRMPDFFTLIMSVVLVFTIVYAVLMFVVAMPFFALVRKGGNFSWGAAILMGLLMHIMLYVLGFLITNGYGMGQLIGLVFLGTIFGVIFAVFYKIFQKRQKPNRDKFGEVFN